LTLLPTSTDGANTTAELSRKVLASLALEGLGREAFGLWLDVGLDVGALEHEGHVVVGTLSMRWPRPVSPPEYVLIDPVHLARPVDEEALSRVVSEARARGLARRRACRCCGRSLNPGLMHTLEVCRSCVAWRLGGAT
jgi:hypothetical protein